MDSTNNETARLDSIVELMAKCINDKFIKIQKMCREFKAEELSHVMLFDEEKTYVIPLSLEYDESKWYMEFKYEDFNCCNELPCKNYKDAVTGMTIADIKAFFKIHRVEVYNRKRERVLEFTV